MVGAPCLPFGGATDELWKAVHILLPLPGGIAMHRVCWVDSWLVGWFVRSLTPDN